MKTFGVVREENKKSTRKKMRSVSISPNGALCHSLLPISMFLSSFSNKLIKSELNSLQLIIFKDLGKSKQNQEISEFKILVGTNVSHVQTV
jgi:hypothetical protein